MGDGTTDETETDDAVTSEDNAESTAGATDSDDPAEPPAWFKNWQESQKTAEKPTAPKPTKKTAVTVKKTTTPPVKKESAEAETETDGPVDRKGRKRTRVSRSWFGSRAEDD